MTGKTKSKTEGAQFVKFFGPVLDALRSLGDSGTPDEVVERVAKDLGISDEAQNELLPSGEIGHVAFVGGDLRGDSDQVLS